MIGTEPIHARCITRPADGTLRKLLPWQHLPQTPPPPAAGFACASTTGAVPAPVYDRFDAGSRGLERVCGDQSGRTSAPINPHLVQTIRGHNDRTGVSSGSQSAFMVAL